ncbi:IS630 family transposase [Halostagnicola sp. A-GB9-2]|uniref:IS630 family transposase n=1 Tax=Halostagnicola sp. A-GB9-2 TaxID=3048066 RepID=UPI0024C07B91|nr:IS630 family transposase [Halostagnicola sp. A-GB9-2]MDJ1433816.1 IS630 family transposase [Halostagnicola sp. A-GB9-2]
MSEDQLDSAINEAQKADETRLVRRLCFIKNLYFGDATKVAAQRVGVSRHTGDRWLAGWNEASVGGLRPSFAGGRPAKLSPEQFEEFFTLLEEGQPWTPQEIDDLLWDRYGVTYDRAHLARILRADGMQYAKPRPMDPRQSPDAEADFRERLEEALAKDNGEKPLVLGFFDACWPQPFENSQRMWSYDRTVEIDKPLVTVPWKTLGFYAILGKRTLIFRKQTTKESICAALEAIREQNPIGRILLIADNDGGHHAKFTQQRADELGIEFVFLPPFSPEFNAIEPLWKTLKRKISPEIFEGEDHFEQFVTDTFLDISKRLGFANSWIEKLIPDVQMLR